MALWNEFQAHESTGTAMQYSVGIGKSTVAYRDFLESDLIIISGQNPGTNHPRMLTSLQAAARRGCQIVSLNPLPETGLNRFKHPQELLQLIGPGTAINRLWLPVRINGDVALLKGLGKALLEVEGIPVGIEVKTVQGFLERRERHR